MGLIYPGAPQPLVLATKERFGIQTFVETGTFRAQTTDFASQHFKSVYTVELVAEHVEAARLRFKNRPHVNVYQGKSSECFPQILTENANAPAIFWLDAHCSLAENCPLLTELRLINASATEAYILIDDARLFMAPPPEPAADWPNLEEILLLASNSGQRTFVIVEDVIIAYPGAAREFVNEYARARPQAWSQNGAVFFVPRPELPNVVVP